MGLITPKEIRLYRAHMNASQPCYTILDSVDDAFIRHYECLMSKMSSISKWYYTIKYSTCSARQFFITSMWSKGIKWWFLVQHKRRLKFNIGCTHLLNFFERMEDFPTYYIRIVHKAGANVIPVLLFHSKRPARLTFKCIFCPIPRRILEGWALQSCWNETYSVYKSVLHHFVWKKERRKFHPWIWVLSWLLPMGDIII